MSYLAAIKPIVRKSRDNKTIVVCCSLLLLIAVIALVGPLLSPHEYASTDFENSFLQPFGGDWHLFGTDDLGRDLFVRTLLGVKVTLLVAIIAMTLHAIAKYRLVHVLAHVENEAQSFANLIDSKRG